MSPGIAVSARVWPGVPRAGLRRRSGGADARPAAPRSGAAATRPPATGRTAATWDELVTELDGEITAVGMRGKMLLADPAAPLHQAASRCSRPATPQGHQPDGRQDLHHAGREDVPGRRCLLP